MSKIFRVHHGSFGHVSALERTSELVTHAHSSANVSFWLLGTPADVLINGTPVGHDTKKAAIIDRFVPRCVKVDSSSSAARSLSFYLDPGLAVAKLTRSPAQEFHASRHRDLGASERRTVDVERHAAS